MEVSRSGCRQTHQAGGVHGHDDRLLLLSREQLQEGKRKHETLQSSCGKSVEELQAQSSLDLGWTHDVAGVDA